METKFNFNSQICTSKSQSEALLKLGLKKETADMKYPCTREYYGGVLTEGTLSIPIIIDTEDDDITEYDIPAWSLGRLVEDLMPQTVTYRLNKYYLSLNLGEGMIGYFPTRLSARLRPLNYFYGNDTILDDCISCIEWLIEEGYFNKEYLEE